MYELNRARLVGIGPTGARYTDVTLDLSDVGERVPSHNLFEPDSRRPSPSTLLMLENGGGKTVLLKLLFSVVLPGRRKTVGGVTLDKFVLDRDTGHVALEWMHVMTGERLVTAKVFQRRTKTSSNSNLLSEAWYSFCPGPALDLSTLPTERVTEDGVRRVRLDGYRGTLEDLNSADPTLQLSWLGDDQGKWRAHLRDRGIEPDLFDIQRSMNVGEGEAATAFQFPSSRAFIDWLLKIVTDPEDSRVIAENFDEWADSLARRDLMLLEKDFLEGAVAGLEPLADAHQATLDNRRDARRTEQAGHILDAQLSARITHERAELTALTGRLEHTRDDVRTKEAERDNARSLRNEVRLQRLRLRLADVEASRDQIRADRTAVALEVAGWQLVDELNERDQADADATAAAAQLAEADQSAAPALARRDEAAANLLAKLDTEARAADSDAEKESTAEQQAVTDAATAATAQQTHSSAIGALTWQLTTAKEAGDEGARRLDAAVKAQLVPAGTVAGAVAGLLASADRDHARAVTHLERAQTAATEAATAARTATTAVRDTDRAASTAAGAATAASRARDDAHAAAGELGQLPAICLAAGEPLASDELDEAVERLQSALDATATAHSNHLSELGSEHREDVRLLTALGDGGLLPPRADVEKAVALLAAGHVAAHPGWRYLHDAVSAGQRADLIDAHPELADGVVVTDAGQLARAQEILARANLLPAAAIAVGATHTLLTLPHPDERTEMFVVEPTPALYDEDAAVVRRDEIATRLDARARSIAEVERQQQEAYAANAELKTYRAAHPAGHLATLTQHAQQADDLAAQAQADLAEAQSALTAAESARDAADAAVDDARTEERSRSDRRGALSVLADQLEVAAKAAASIDQLNRDLRGHQDKAADAGRRQVEYQTAARTCASRAADARNRAEQLRRAASAVVSTSGVRAKAIPALSVAELEAHLNAAQSVYEQVAVDQDLVTRAREASEDLRRRDDELTRRDPAHVEEARRLRQTAPGADPASRAVALNNARRRQTELEAAEQSAAEQVGQAQNQVTAAQPNDARKSWVVLTAEWTARDTEHASTLEVRAENAHGSAQAQLEEAAAHAAALGMQAAQLKDDVAAFELAHAPLRAVLSPRGPKSAVAADVTDVADVADVDALEGRGDGTGGLYPGTADEAGADVEIALETLDTARQRLAIAEHALAEAGSQLRQFTQDTKFDTLQLAARRSILGSSDETLASKSGHWATELTGRLVSLNLDLENADRHRAWITDRLAALVDQALRTLRLATKLSELPAELHEWGGRKFLRIAFASTDATSIKVHVADVVDQAAREYARRRATSRGTSPQRDGMSLLLDAVHASVPKGFTVDVLKPDSVLRDERVSIQEMSEVFSGGQELTAAIVLYCTLAALSANERGQMRARHSGVLFLDNPIGRASAAYLLDLQQAVARALGVQLIYTTGLMDHRVLAAFPLWIRMRNDADLRAGLKHIQVAEVVRAAMPDPYSTDVSLSPHATQSGEDEGTVTAARVYLRPGTEHSRPSRSDGRGEQRELAGR